MQSTLEQLNKAYAKRLLQVDKDLQSKIAAAFGLQTIIERLKYLRDTYIITHKSTDTIATLNAAIEELEAYIATKREFHWDNFCEFARLNAREWLVTNDSV